MIIHSITPLPYLLEQPEAPTCSLRTINGGYLEGVDTPQGFRTSRLVTTDPALYLKNEYAPGSILPQNTHHSY